MGGLAAFDTWLVNSTLSGNVASHLGGGLYAADSQTQLLNATIADNQVHYHIASQPGLGGGLYLTHTSVLVARNSIIANNLHISDKGPQDLDDCSSVDTTGGLYYNLFTTMAHCTIIIGGLIRKIVRLEPPLGTLPDKRGCATQPALLCRL